MVDKSNKAKKGIVLKQPYGVTFAGYKLNIHEQRIFIMIIKSLQPEMNKDVIDCKKDKQLAEEIGLLERKQITVKTTIFEDKIIQIPTKFLLPKGSQNYKCVKDALKSLRERTITIKSSNSLGKYCTYTGIILSSRYYQNNEMVEIQLGRDILPNLITMSRGYTKYLLNVAFSLKTTFAIRMYQKISHWRNQKNKELNLLIEEYRYFLGLSNKYSNSAQFRQSVLEPVQKELKKKADMFFEIKEPIKKGRKIIGWKIVIYNKNSDMQINPIISANTPKASDFFVIDSNEYKEKFDVLIKELRLPEKVASKILKKVPKSQILRVIYDIRQNKDNIKAIGGYSYACFKSLLN